MPGSPLIASMSSSPSADVRPQNAGHKYKDGHHGQDDVDSNVELWEKTVVVVVAFTFI